MNCICICINKIVSACVNRKNYPIQFQWTIKSGHICQVIFCRGGHFKLYVQPVYINQPYILRIYIFFPLRAGPSVSEAGPSLSEDEQWVVMQSCYMYVTA